MISDGENLGVIPINRIEPYYKIALKVAQESPCQRRKYGAVIGYADSISLVSACNARVTKCCDGNICVRERYGLSNGERTELGAEVHAEQAVLIDAPKRGDIFVLAGWKIGPTAQTILLGADSYPCLVCARMIKYAGYKWVYIKNEKEILEPIHIETIIEYREMEASPYYD